MKKIILRKRVSGERITTLISYEFTEQVGSALGSHTINSGWACFLWLLVIDRTLALSVYIPQASKKQKQRKKCSGQQTDRCLRFFKKSKRTFCWKVVLIARRVLAIFHVFYKLFSVVRMFEVSPIGQRRINWRFGALPLCTVPVERLAAKDQHQTVLLPSSMDYG